MHIDTGGFQLPLLQEHLIHRKRPGTGPDDICVRIFLSYRNVFRIPFFRWLSLYPIFIYVRYGDKLLAPAFVCIFMYVLFG
jgi:hypothetical protein